MPNLPDGKMTKSVRDLCAVQLVFVMHAFREMIGPSTGTPAQLSVSPPSTSPSRSMRTPTLTPVVLAAASPYG
jgi:hypothetical protein